MKINKFVSYNVEQFLDKHPQIKQVLSELAKKITDAFGKSLEYDLEIDDEINTLFIFIKSRLKGREKIKKNGEILKNWETLLKPEINEFISIIVK